MDLDYFISLHTVYIEFSQIIVEQFNNIFKVNYLDKFEITYNLTENFTELEINFNFNNMINEFEQAHYIRLINKLNNTTLNYQFKCLINLTNYDLVESFLINLNKILQLGINLCTGCGTELKIKGTGLISHCDDIYCKQNYFNYVTDNRVIQAYNKDSKVFEFLLQILISGINHPKGSMAFKPLPSIPGVNSLERLKEVIPLELTNTDITKIYNCIQNSLTDFELQSKIGEMNYCILKNAISDNYFSMSSRVHVSGDKKKVKTVNSLNKEEEKEEHETNIIFLNINYSAEIENKFPQKYYLFHGSSVYSWYPIVKNGLKVMSGTALQANGAAHGPGIYFSDSFEMSLGYSIRSICNNYPYNIVSVFEILQDPTQYKKTAGIFVITDDSILVLRYFVLVKIGSKLPKDITKTFTLEIPAQKQVNRTSVILVKSKRLNAEYKKISDESFIKEVIILDEFTWIIKFQDIKSHSVIIELKFSNYPLYPPDIKLVSPKQLGSIGDSQQNIKIPLTNPNTWEITNTLSQICLFLYNCICETI